MKTTTTITLLSLCLLGAGCVSSPETTSPAGDPAGAAAGSDAEPIAADRATLVVRGLSCPLCATNIDKQLMRMPGVASATVDLGSGEVALEFSALAAPPSRDELRQAVKDAGYTLAEIRVPGGAE